ncbi:MAG: NADH-quinone oxidoreductase subunit G [Nocardioides sp.]|uniref:NADH-quinone oxidoreductase subunit G n=1 Tax=Nocardioides sp. TaxID=35761 RepID=UPI0039E3889D
MSDVTLTIDGEQVTVPEGTLVIRAAERMGIEIPRFCDHPLLAPVGACRQCLVDIPDAGNGRGFPKPQASCTIPVAEGMVVQTANATAVKAQQGIMEFLLVNHPLDCPVCDKGGECPLQNQAMSHGQGESRFADSGGVKRTFPKPISLSANVLLDRERCIVCQRCTRFAAEIAGDPFIALVERGAEQQIGIAEDAPFSSYFSGNAIQICPVGALTSAEYRFRARPFDLVSTPGIAEHDACGAAIRIDHRRGKVLRRLAGNDPAVNEEWISDKDRYAFRYAVAPDRLTHPWVREDGELRPAAWPEAFALAARGLAAAGRTAVLTGGRLTLEDARAYAGFARDVLHTADRDFRARPLSAEETGFLAEHVAGAATGVTYADLDTATVVLLVGFEPEDEAGTIFLRLRKAVAGGLSVTTIAPFLSRGSGKLSATLVRTAPGEEAAALDGIELPPDAIILAGERLAISPGGLPAAVALAARTGARLAWIPRRAGDRGAIEAGLLPVDGRDADQIVEATVAGEIDGLLVGGVDPDDTADPAAFRRALAAADFVVSLELSASEVSRAADVILPVATVAEKAGTFLTWEGRARHFERVFDRPASFSDAQILDHITKEYAAARGLDTPALVPREGYSTSEESVGRPAGAGGQGVGRAASASDGSVGRPASASDEGVGRVASASERIETPRPYRLATWKLMLDNGRLQGGDKALAATARPAVVLLAADDYQRLGATVTVIGDRGSWTLPAAPADLPESTVWLPSNSFGRGVLADLASPGSRVDVEAADV